MASTEFRTLEGRLDRVVDRLTLGVEKLMETVIENIGAEVVTDTPVKTGFAKANWRPSIGAPTPNPISFLDPTGQATISRIKTIARLYQIGDTVFITNRSPYIEQLNDGHSPQAPAGYVQVATQRGVDIAFNRSVGGIL